MSAGSRWNKPGSEPCLNVHGGWTWPASQELKVQVRSWGHIIHVLETWAYVWSPLSCFEPFTGLTFLWEVEMDPDLWFRVLFFIFSEDQSGEGEPSAP